MNKALKVVLAVLGLTVIVTAVAFLRPKSLYTVDIGVMGMTVWKSENKVTRAVVAFDPATGNRLWKKTCTRNFSGPGFDKDGNIEVRMTFGKVRYDHAGKKLVAPKRRREIRLGDEIHVVNEWEEDRDYEHAAHYRYIDRGTPDAEFAGFIASDATVNDWIVAAIDRKTGSEMWRKEGVSGRTFHHEDCFVLLENSLQTNAAALARNEAGITVISEHRLKERKRVFRPSLEDMDILNSRTLGGTFFGIATPRIGQMNQEFGNFFELMNANPHQATGVVGISLR